MDLAGLADALQPDLAVWLKLQAVQHRLRQLCVAWSRCTAESDAQHMLCRPVRNARECLLPTAFVQPQRMHHLLDADMSSMPEAHRSMDSTDKQG